MEYQKTVAGIVFFEGEGIYSGKEIRVELHPLRENEGIIFERADLAHRPRIKLSLDKVVALDGAVLITDGKWEITLIEHLLSALHGLEIDNVLVKVFGSEIPLLDGSTFKIVRKIQEKGYLFLPAPRKRLILKRPFEMVNGIGKISLSPASRLKIFASIHFDHPLIGEQSFEFISSPWNYIREISFARTFGFKEILEERKKQGILKGGTLSNAIVIDKEGILNEEGLRSRDEFVRHKILDILGDLFTLGLPLLAEVKACSTGHKLHIEALKNMFKAGYFEEVETRALAFLWISKRKRSIS
ncbi:MAG: UDP-3-O-acyl-N-acetylglucosamine deacetylase [Caldimicrobium sp.]|nr:UDP-3-O-acyl-N-acetylglucosamine deacetylase [Caldimicrobium sp.]MCX7874503.1 UDP-3-O-acyl-N-acetylglucosamine deacetylase [Caldimicrobium sp.]MDW8094540.1 UDP-3-O-acyl-N-acetylglucosamine deacetylase [Caldimicrobium sp.]